MTEQLSSLDRHEDTMEPWFEAAQALKDCR
jgi:hypothetical protein